MVAAGWPAAASPTATSEERAIGFPPLPIWPFDCCCVHWIHCRARCALLGKGLAAAALSAPSRRRGMTIEIAGNSRFMVSSRACDEQLEADSESPEKTKAPKPQRREQTTM